MSLRSSSSLSLALLFTLAAAGPAAAVRMRSHGSLNECIVTWGSFCPVESFGLSLLATAGLTALAFAVWFVASKLCDGARKAGHGGIAAIFSLAARYPIFAFGAVVLAIAALFDK